MSISRRTVLASAGAAALAGCKKPLPAFTFAVSSPVWWNPVPLVAERRGALKNKGFELKTLLLESGLKVRQAVAAGTADMGVASTNAFTTATDTELQSLRILASITHTSAMVAMLSRVSEPSELMKGRIGYTPGTMSELYLIAYLQKSLQVELYSRKELLLVPLDPPSMVAAFQRGDIDVAVTWEPYASQIASGTVYMSPSAVQAPDADEAGGQSSAGPSASPVVAQAPDQIRDESLYGLNIFVFASTAALQTKKPQVDAALAGLKATCDWIAANRMQAARELEGVFREQHIAIAANPLWNTVAVEYNPSTTVIHEALLRDHQLGVLAGMGRASLNGLNVLTAT